MQNNTKFGIMLTIAIIIGILLVTGPNMLNYKPTKEPFISHRTENEGYQTTWDKIILRAGRTFLYGQFHTASLHFPIIISTVAAAIIIGLKKEKKT